MAKTKISEYDATAGNNTDINSINIDEGCSPSGINNAIRAAMSHLKAFQTGTAGDSLVVGGNLSVTGTSTLSADLIANSSSGTSGQALLSRGAGLSPQWGAAFVSGMIMMWSGSIATIPTGWYLCNGSNSTPDLRNRFIIGAYSDNTGVANTTITGSQTLTGGAADAIVVSHTHTATSSVSDPSHTHMATHLNTFSGSSVGYEGKTGSYSGLQNGSASTGISVSTSISTTGSSGTNANLPPYYALAFIMKA